MSSKERKDKLAHISRGGGGSGEQPALLIQALSSLLFKFIHIIAHFSSVASCCKLSTLMLLLPQPPEPESRAWEWGSRAAVARRLELIFTAFLPGAGTPWFPSEVSKDSEKLAPCPLKQAGGRPAVGQSAEALGVRVRGGDLAGGRSP